MVRTWYVRGCLILCMFTGLLGKPVVGATTIAGAGGITAAIDPGGSYDVWVATTGWHFGGNLGVPLSNIGAAMSMDAIGPYSEISFDFQTDAARHGAVRAYANQPVVLFTITSPSPAPNSLSFPNWSQYPQNVDRLTYSGIFAPPSFNSSSNEGPWAFFDSSANTFIVSPAGHFMASITGFGPNGELSSGISAQIATLPQGFQQRTFLVVEPGINRAFETWGHAMTAFFNKARPAYDADISLNKIGYWTDNGATYYYQTANGQSTSKRSWESNPISTNWGSAWGISNWIVGFIRKDRPRPGAQTGTASISTWLPRHCSRTACPGSKITWEFR